MEQVGKFMIDNPFYKGIGDLGPVKKGFFGVEEAEGVITQLENYVEGSKRSTAKELRRATNNAFWGAVGLTLGAVLTATVPGPLKGLMAVGTVGWAAFTFAPGVAVHVGDAFAKEHA